MVRRAAGVSSGALGKRSGQTAAAVRVFSVWRRAEAVHREHVRADGSERGPGNDRAEVPGRGGARAGGEADGVEHHAAEERDSNEAGGALTACSVCCGPWQRKQSMNRRRDIGLGRKAPASKEMS